jgi:putative membrane protein
MIDRQAATMDDPNGPGTASHGKHAGPGEAAAEKAKKSLKASEKALEQAEKMAERWEKQQDRLAKLHLDGDKLMLRWLRTGLGLVTTGIAIERGLKALQDARVSPSLDPYSVLRMVGLGLVLIGIGALCVASAQHYRRLQAIRQGDPAPVLNFSLSLWVSLAVAFLSIIAFISALVSFSSGSPVI